MVDRPWIIYTQCEQCVITVNIMLSSEQAAMSMDIPHIWAYKLGEGWWTWRSKWECENPSGKNRLSSWILIKWSVEGMMKKRLCTSSQCDLGWMVITDIQGSWEKQQIGWIPCLSICAELVFWVGWCFVRLWLPGQALLYLYQSGFSGMACDACVEQRQPLSIWGT